VAAALVLVIVGGATLPALRAFRPLPARSAGDWSYALSVVPPDGWQIASHALTAHQESIEIAGEPGRCEVLASLPAAAARDRIEVPRSSQRVWIQGRPVRYAEDDGVSRIFWPYADGGEVSLTCDGMPDARAFTLELAERLEFRPGQGLRVPVVFGTVPDGLHPAYAASDQDQLIIGMITGEDLENPGTYLIVGLFSGVFEDATLTRTRPATVNGAPAELRTSDGMALLCLPPDSSRPICVGSGVETDEEPPDAEARAALGASIRRVQAVADQLRIAPDLEDRSTWIDARDALQR
jgi:hypothetical protein